MMALLPAILGVVALAAAAVMMVHKSRTCGREIEAHGADDPLFFVRYRPGIAEVKSSGPAPASGKTSPDAENH